MTELNEILDQYVDAMIAGSSLPLSEASSDLLPLVRIATDLRDLPREAFKARLKEDLNRRTVMTKTATKKIDSVNKRYSTVTPYLSVLEVHELIEFVKQAFGAEGKIYGTGSQGGIHSEYKIGDSMLMIGGGERWRGNPMPMSLHVYVEDADEAYQRAIDAGATSMYEPIDQEYGDREAGVKDLCGNEWFIATHKGEQHIPEGLNTVTPFLHPRGAAEMIEFLVPAFGAEEVSRSQSPDGAIQHATIRIGDSMIEMGEAHGEWQPMPGVFYLYVDDVDKWHNRAVTAGASSVSEPSDQSYGGRGSSIKDPFDNIWYLGASVGDEA